MLFAKIKEKLLNRRNDIEISEVSGSNGHVFPAEKMFKFLEYLSDNIGTDDDGGFYFNNLHAYNLYLESLLNILDINGDSLLPLSEDNAGKVLSVNGAGTGVEAVEVSSMTLLGTAHLPDVQAGTNIFAYFNNIDVTKITSKTLLIFTYDNCFVIGMLGQTGVGKVAGLIRSGYTGNVDYDYTIGKVTFTIDSEHSALQVDTDVSSSFSTGTAPTAYLFAFTVR